jgi:SAM-dependent methyltransferase
MSVHVDEIFANPRLAELYDHFDGDRSDLDAYLAIAQELSAHCVVDVGCGTGVFACLLANHGFDVIGVDPAEASLTVARRKPGADRITWLLGDARALTNCGEGPVADLVTMTANVAQVFLSDEDWLATLGHIHAALLPTGHFVFEVRDPAQRAWEQWNREASSVSITIDGTGTVEGWVELTEVALPFLSFRWSYRFGEDGATVTSDSTLRFRTRAEITDSLTASGFGVCDVRDAPDRPGKEFVFLARKVQAR